MDDASDKLTEWTDPVLGDLVWDDEDGAWSGTTDIDGRDVVLTVTSDTIVEGGAATRADQEAALDEARPLLDRVLEMEPKFRRLAAEEIANAAGDEGDEETAHSALDEVDELADVLQLEAVSLHGSGELFYTDSSAKFFPDAEITVYFEEDLSFGGAEVSE